MGEQTYINQNEARDGDDVVGSYSFVDANGDLVTINYQAGAMGFTQSMDKTVGAVEMRARPAKKTATSASVSASNSASNSASSAFNSGSSTSSGFNSGSSTSNSFNSGSFSANGFNSGSVVSSASIDTAALIAQIMRFLEPQIVIAVDSAVARL